MGFVDDQEGIVFVQNIEVNRGCGRRRTLFSALTLQTSISSPFGRCVSSMHNFAVHHHLAWVSIFRRVAPLDEGKRSEERQGGRSRP